LMLLSRVEDGITYLGTVLPGVIVFGLGLTLTVAPLTATVMAAADARYAGIASGVNNAVSRAAGLLAIAVIPGLAGITGNAYLDPVAFAGGFRRAMLISAALAAAGGVLAWLMIRNQLAARAHACPAGQLDRRHFCAIDGAPLSTKRDADRARRPAA
jgi:hypothetical protein